MQSEQDLQEQPIQETAQQVPQEPTPTELPDLNVQTKDQAPKPIQGEDPPSKKLWQGFVDNGAYTGTFEDFQKKTSNKDQIDNLYLGLSDADAFTGSKDDFYKNFFPDVSQEFEQPKEDAITATLKANALKNKKKKIQTTVYDPMMGDVVTETEETDIDANKEGLNLESDLEKRGYKKEQRDQILDEFRDVNIDEFDKTYNRKELADLREKDYLKYAYILNNAKTQFDIKKAAGQKASDEYVQAANTLKKVGGTVEDLNRLQNNNQYKIDIINNTLTGEERDKALNRLNEYTSMVVSKDVSPQQAKDYLNAKLFGTDKQFAPSEVTPFTTEQVPFGGDVSQLSLDSVAENLDPNNPVEQVVFNKYKYGVNLNDAIKNTATFDDAAMEFAKLQDPQISGYAETIQLPNETKGRLVKQWLDNPNVIQMVQQNPDLLKRYNDTKTKFESNYPDYVANGAAQKISNKRQELGWNNFLVNVPSQSATDELAQQMHENGELSDQEYFQYQNQISPEVGVMQSLKRNILNTNPLFALAGYGGNESPIKTPGIAENFAIAMSSGFENIGKFGKDVAQYMTPAGYIAPEVFKKLDAKRLYKNVLTNEKATTLVNAGALHKWSENTGNILGSIIPIMLGGEISAAAKLGGWTGELIGGALPFEGQNRDQSMVLFPGEKNEGKRNAYTIISTLGDAFLMRFLPTGKIASAFKKETAGIIEDLASKKITQEAAKNKILDLGYKIAKENAKTSGAMTFGYGLFHKGVVSMFNGDDINAGKLALESLKEYKSTFLSTIPLAALTTIGNYKYHGKLIKEMAENPEAYAQFIANKIKTNPEFQKEGNEQLENLRVSTDILSDINQTNLTDAQKEKYLLNGVAQNIYERRAKETKDENVAKLNLAKAKEFADKNKKIFDGKDEAKEFETFGEEGQTKEIKQALDKEKLDVEEALPEEKDVTIGDVMDKKGKYKGQEGTFYQDGQTVVFAVDGTNREYEIGNIDEIKDTPIKDFGIEHKESVITVGDDNRITVRDEEFFNNEEDPMSAVKRDKDGNVTGVVLSTANGKKRKFGGNIAEDIAYQLHLKEINKNNETRAEFEQHINEDAAAQKEINDAGVSETTTTGAVENNEPIQRKKIQPVVKKTAPTSKAKAPSKEPSETPSEAPKKKPLTKQQKIAQKFLQEVEGVEPEVKEVTPPKVHTVENIDKIDTKGYNETQKKALSSAKEIVKSIANLVQQSTKKKLEVVIHDNKETYTDEVIKAGGTRQDSESKGFYLGKDGKIHLNMELVSSETLKHEAFHPVLDFMADNNPKIINDLHEQLKKLPGGQNVVDRAERTYKGDNPTTIKKEAITDYIARVADGSIPLERNTWQQVKDYIITALNKLGINISKDIKSISDLQELAREISRKFQTGEEVKTKGKADALKTLTSMQKQATVYGNSKIVKKPALDSEKSDEAIKSGRVKVISPKDSLEGLTFAITHWDDLFVGDIFMGDKKIGSFDGGVFYPLNGGDKGKMGASVSTGSAGAFASQVNRSLFINNGITLPENFSDGSFVVSKGKGERGFILTNKQGEKFELTLPENPNPGVVVMGKGSDLKHKTSLAAKVGFVKTLLAYAKGKEGYEGLVNAIKSTYSIGNVKNADSVIELFDNYLKGGRMADGQTMSEANSSYDSFRASLVKNANPIITKMLKDMGYDENSFILGTNGEKQFVFDRTKWKKGEYQASGVGVDKMFMDLGQEDFLKGLETGDAYAALKIKSPVIFEKDDTHPSYPFAIKTIDKSAVGIDIFNKTFRTFGKNQGVTGREVKEGKEETGSFGVTTTTKPTFKIKQDLNLNDPSSKNLNDALANYESISRTGVLPKPQFSKPEPIKSVEPYKEVIKGTLRDEELKPILEANLDYFKQIKKGTIGVRSVEFGKEDGITYMDTFDVVGDKGARYYVTENNKFNINKPSLKIEKGATKELGKAKGWSQEGDLYTNNDTGYSIMFDKDLGENGLYQVLDTEGFDAIGEGFEDIKTAKEVADEQYIVDTEAELPTQKPQLSKAESELSDEENKMTIYHGGDIVDLSSLRANEPFFVTETESEAIEYSKGNDGHVFIAKIDKSKIADEDIARDILEEMGYPKDEYMLHELIDPRFEDSYIGENNTKKLYSEIEKKGYEGIRFLDSGIGTTKNVENIFLVNPKKTLKNSTFEIQMTVNQFKADKLFKEGYRPIVDGNIINVDQNGLDNLFKKSETIKMGKPKVVESISSKEQTKLSQQKPQLSKAENKASSMMRELVQSHLDEGKSLEEIKEEIKKDFGSFYDKHEALLEQTYQDLTTTGIKNAVTKAERAERGLDEVEVEMKRGFGDVVDNAKKAIEEGKISPELLAAEIAKKPRPLSAEESAALIIDRVKISNQYDAKFKQLQDAYDKGDTNQAKVIESQLYVLEERMQINDEASRKSGYEQGLGLAARRMLMARDYSLATQLARAKAANGGKELPKDVRKKFEELTQKLQDANAKLDEYQTKEAKKELDKEVKATKKSASTLEQIAKQKESVKQTIFGKLKNFLKGAVTPKAKEGEGGAMYSKAPAMTPEQEAKSKYLTEISGDVKKLVKLYAEGGNRNLDNIINDIHKDISAQFPEVTKEDIQDVVVGNYNKVKVATPLDATKLAIQANVKRVQNEIDLLRDNLALKQRGKGELLMDYLHGWHRFALLSSIPSIPKIAGAALGRGLTSRLEGVIGQGLSYVPGLRGIAKGAIREGRLSPKAEAKAFAQWFDKMTFEDLRNIYKTGMSDLDIQYGDKKEFAAKVPQWMEFFGRMHSMIKYLPKRAEFFRSMEMRAEQAIKEGKDPKDPVVQYELGLEAYNDALRAVFMQDNAISDAYKSVINKWEKSDVQGMPTVANLFKFLFPIIKVPTNYVAEQSSYAIGGFKAGTTLVKAALSLENGIKDLTPQQKDNVMRALKKQTIGIAIALLGYYNPEAIGGYYTGKRKENDLEAGDIVVFGVKLPHWASHTPLLEMLQVGATIRRAMDAKDEKSKYKGEWAKFGEGAFDAAIETVKKIPFVSGGERIADAWGDENKLSKFASGLAQSIIEPQALKNAAEFFDKEEGGEKVKREPKTFVETLKTGIPGLREQVPIKKTYSFLKEKDYEDKDFKVLKDNGITVGIGKRTAINVGFSKDHPDGHMTEEEYDKYYEEANNYIKNGGVVTDQEGNQKTIPSLKEFLNSNADMTLSDIYGDEVSTESSLVKDLPTSPMTIEQGGKKIEAKGLDNPLQDAIDAYKSDVFKAVKEKMKLAPKTYKSKLNLEYKEFNKD
jgi:hypothetical protein